MSRIRKIIKNPTKHKKNYFFVDACFLANKYIPLKVAPDVSERNRLRACHVWWKEIDRQLNLDVARVYIPDICIAEAFKVLAKKYYVEHWFKLPNDLRIARKKLSKDVTINTKILKSPRRKTKYHDISTSRDIIISVDRFYEAFMKHKRKVQIADLILVATVKYAMDFYDLPRSQVHIITLDNDLRLGIKNILELPNAYDPTNRNDAFEKVFCFQRKT
ncbi:MAG TPA: hypothetical protein ENI51_00015 [Candidatus Atribacteria bacterium]|nr:hypothetical protein [Candidatus Atribacteria bacterium]